MDAEPQRRGAKVVDAILQATVEELARVGYSGLSVEEVASRAGVNKTTVYRRWPTKNELVLAALSSGRESQADPPDTGNVRDDVLEYMRGVRDGLSSALGRGVYLALLADDPAIAGVAATLRAHGEKQMRKILRRGISRGELPPSAESSFIGDAIFGALSFRLFFMREAEVSDDYLRTIIDVAIAGAKSVASRPRSPNRRAT